MIAKVIVAVALLAVSLSVPVEEKHQPQPYEYGFETDDGHGTTSFRKESSDGKGKVQGSYGYKDLHGIERVVEYVADEHGYRAEIKTNEPGTESQNPADVILHAEPVQVEEPKPAYGAPAHHYAAPHPHYAAPEHHYFAPPHHYAPEPYYPRY